MMHKKPPSNNTTAFRLQMAVLNDKGQPDSKGAYYIMTAGGFDGTGNAVGTADIYNLHGHQDVSLKWKQDQQVDQDSPTEPNI